MTIKIPHDEAAEAALIASALIRGAAEDCGVTHADFHNFGWGMVWATIRETPASVDALAVCSRLREKGFASLAGKPVDDAIMDAMSSGLVVASNYEAYASRVSALATARRAILGITRALSQLSESVTPDTIETARGEIRSVLDGMHGTEELPTIADQVTSAIAQLEQRAKHDGIMLTTGIASLDRVTGGYIPGALHCIAARPGCGKSSLAMQSARANAEAGVPVLVFSLEAPPEAVIHREISANTGIPLLDLWRAITTSEARQVFDAASHVAQMPLTILHGSYSPEAIISKARTWRNKHRGSEHALIIVDYLQIVRGRAQDNEYQTVTKACKALKALASDTGDAIVMCSQFSRGKAETRGSLSNLRGSGSIEEDSDLIVMPYREPTGESPDESSNERMAASGPIELHVAKNKWGSTGMVEAWWEPKRMTFSENR